MSGLTKISGAGMITATLAALAAAIAIGAPVAPANGINIKITDNIREAVSILDVQLAVVIDKRNRIHVLTVGDIKNPEESEVENLNGNGPMEASVANVTGGKFSTHIRQTADGCWWLTRGERNQEGALIEPDEVCIGGRGCPIGERRPLAEVLSSSSSRLFDHA